MSAPSSTSRGRTTVAHRLSLAFGLVVLVLLVVAGASLYTANRLEAAERANVRTEEAATTAGEMLSDMLAMQGGARGFLLSGDERFLAAWDSGHKAFEQHLTRARQLVAGDEAQLRRLDGMDARRGELERVLTPLIKERREIASGRGLLADLVGTFMEGLDQAAMDNFRAVHGEFDQAQRELAAASIAAAQHTRSINLVVLAAGPLLAVALAVGLGVWITRSITRQLGGEPDEATRVARDIAQGDLCTDVATRHGGAGDGSLMAAMAAMRGQLVNTVGEVRRNAEGVAAASAQIAQGNHNLSQRTEQQATALQQTAASMEQLGGTVRHNAENAQQANQLAQGASDVAVRGGAVVAQVVGTMRGIEESSRKIADIINVIDGIAFQTNILALNAAVEAARAGEAGRGFAVVAGEVRSLAQRSATAAREIKGLINDSVSRVGQGSALADQAGRTMEEVVSAIKRVTDLVGEISHASVEQSEGVAQVAEAVSGMDRATQQNAALVEDSAAAAERLRTQAQHLVQAVAVFRLAAGAGGFAPSLSTTPAFTSAAPAPVTAPAPRDGAPRTPRPKAADTPRPASRPAAPAQPALAVTHDAPPSRAAQDDQEEWTSF
jgi:methyl-accepting chemotaxis protein